MWNDEIASKSGFHIPAGLSDKDLKWENAACVKDTAIVFLASSVPREKFGACSSVWMHEHALQVADG